ncbi:MAG: hypothetical protein LBI42_04810 [Chitinispirillales bacterium]|jgi:hypothetical protein|nr:hypothetical protein [Chitinispirillales bacterium]
MNRISKATLFSAVLCFASLTAQAQPTPSTSWYTNNPSAATFTISTADDLAGLARIVNGTWGGSPASFNFNGRTINLANDINLSGYGSSYNNGVGWIPIGDSSSYSRNFSGTFDGNGKNISGLYTNRNKIFTGLFGCLSGANSVVKNVNIVNADVTGTNRVGVIAGTVTQGSVINCSVVGSSVSIYDSSTAYTSIAGIVGYINDGSITNSSFIGIVTGINADDVGGVAGYIGNNTIVTSCYSNGSVSGKDYVGGIIGRSFSSSITSCYSTASVNGNSSVGGLIGRLLTGSVTNCYSLGTVTSASDYVGGVVGYSTGDITKCYSASSVKGKKYAGSIAGTISNNTAKIEHCAALSMNIKVDSGLIGRITSSSSNGILSSNFAYDGMVLVTKTPTSNPNGLDGKDLSSCDIYADGSLGGLFMNNGSPWVTENGKLPGFGAPVNMPGYISSWSCVVDLVSQIESMSYFEIQANADNITQANAAVETIIANSGLNQQYNFPVTVNDISFKAAIAGTPCDSLGKNGNYKFTVTVGSITTSVLTLYITATPYSALLPMAKAAIPVQNNSITLSGEFTAGPNPVAKHSGAVNFFKQGAGLKNGELSIYGSSGNLVKVISINDNNMDNLSKRQVASWNLTDSKGRQVSAGTYLVKGTVTKQDGGKEKISLIVGVR